MQGSQWHGLHIFDALEPKFTPFKFVLCVELITDPLNCPVRGVFTLHYASAWKRRNDFPLVRHRYHSSDLGKSAMLSEAVCIPLYSQNPNTTFKIRFWVLTHGLWRAGSLEYRVITSKLMKRGWKYPLKHQEGREGTPWKIANWEPWYAHFVVLGLVIMSSKSVHSLVGKRSVVQKI